MEGESIQAFGVAANRVKYNRWLQRLAAILLAQPRSLYRHQAGQMGKRQCATFRCQNAKSRANCEDFTLVEAWRLAKRAAPHTSQPRSLICPNWLATRSRTLPWFLTGF
jgi:hypothetical protein